MLRFHIFIALTFIGLLAISQGEAKETIWIYNPAGESASVPGFFVDDLIKNVMVNQKLPGPPLAGEFPHYRIEIIVTEKPLEEVNELFYR